MNTQLLPEVFRNPIPYSVCSSRMFGDSVIPLPHIYGARIKGVEVFCPLDPPPPYEAVEVRQAEPSQVNMSTFTFGRCFCPMLT